jgi:predicted peroxiredoxin
VERH